MTDSIVHERWMPVVGWEGVYEISSAGRVKSLERTARIFGGHVRRVRERILSQGYSVGYKFVSLKNNRRLSIKVHRLVLEAFIGPCPHGMECCHNNGDRTDNRLENLRWDTPRNNCGDAVKHGTSNRGERCFNSILTEPEVLQVRTLCGISDLSYREIGGMYGIAISTVCNIYKRRVWSWLKDEEC